MNKFLTATFVALLSTAAFAQGVIPEATYIITGSEGQFTAKRGVYSAITNCGSNDPPNNCIPEYVTVGEANKSIQTVIDAIRADAVSYMGDRFLAHIQFGDLYISGDSVQFTGVGWGSITLSGKIRSKGINPTIKIGQGVSIDSKADIVNARGSYAIHNSGRLSITGGTVKATNCGYSDDPNDFVICIPENYSIPVYHNNEDTPLILGGSPSIPSTMAGSIYIASGKLEVAPNFAPGTERYRIILRNEEVFAGRVVVANGKDYAENFAEAPTRFLTDLEWGLAVSGDDLVIGEVTNPIIKPVTANYIITGSEGQFTAKRGDYSTITNCSSNGSPNNCIPEYVTVGEANQPIQAVIDAIRANEVPLPIEGAKPIHIQFGDNIDELDIGRDSVQFINDGTGSWLGHITLWGRIISRGSSPTIKIGQDVSINSEAAISNIGGGYAIRNSGRLSITGGMVTTTLIIVVPLVGSGTVSTTPLITNCGSNSPPDNCVPGEYYSRPPVYHDNKDFPLVLGGSPFIPPSSGNIPGSAPASIYIASGKLVIAPDFVSGTEIYRIGVSADIKHERGVLVINGAAYADNFGLSDVTWPILRLVVSGDDLVIGEETAPIIKSKAASGFGIVLNGNSLQVVGISQATPISVYDLRGNVVMSGTALPNESVSVSHLPKGVYVAKVGGMAVKVVR